MGVREAQQRISAEEFGEWVAFFTAEPWGEERADLRSGIIAATVANCHAQGRKQFKAEDFMPTFGRPKRRQSIEEMQSRIMLACSMNESIKKG